MNTEIWFYYVSTLQLQMCQSSTTEGHTISSFFLEGETSSVLTGDYNNHCYYYYCGWTKFGFSLLLLDCTNTALHHWDVNLWDLQLLH